MIWRALPGQVSLDDALQKIGVQLAFKSACCEQPFCETVNHVFVNNSGARAVWLQFEHILGVHSGSSLLQLKLNDWWLTKVRSLCFKEILSFVPACICWELWRCQNLGKFEQQLMPTSCLIDNILQHISAVFSTSLLNKADCKDVTLLKNVGLLNVQVISRQILVLHYNKPLRGRVKLNPNGCSKGNPSISGGGSILRDCEGKVIWAQADGFGHQSNMVAETRALLQGVKKCLANGYVQVDLEMDSFILMQILNREVEIPWFVLYEVRELWRCINQMNVQLIHAYREVNHAADVLTNIGGKFQKFVSFVCFGELSHKVKGIVNLDRMGVPALGWKRV